VLVAKIMTKMKDVPGLSSVQSTIQGVKQGQSTPPSMNVIRSTSVVKESTGVPYEKTGEVSELTGSRTEKVVASFLQNPLIQPERNVGTSEKVTCIVHDMVNRQIRHWINNGNGSLNQFLLVQHN
jgi:hypothetical protein